MFLLSRLPAANTFMLRVSEAGLNSRCATYCYGPTFAYAWQLGGYFLPDSKTIRSITLLSGETHFSDLTTCVGRMRSVVLAACQGERFIAEQLISIAAQLAPDDEIVISDDASTDATLDIIRRVSDPRVRIFSNRVRLGYIGNFEKAVGFARGDLIFFSDQDDVWLPNKVAAMDVALERKPCAASDAIVVDERLSVMHESFFAWRGTRTFSASEMFLRPAIVGATLACRRSYLQTLLPFPPGVPHDFWLTLNAAWDDSFAIIREPLILYRRHDAAVSPSGTARRRNWKIIVAERARIASAFLSRRLLRRRSSSQNKVVS